MKKETQARTWLRHVPNFITSLRIVGTACLLFMEPFTAVFYVLYAFCGFSDVLDGFLARRTHTTSQLGSKLDSAADLMLYTLILLRIFPTLWARLPRWIWCLVGGALLLRVCSYTTVAVKYRQFASIHTYMNKASGLAVFLVPFFIVWRYAVPACTVVCVIAVTASLEELLIHLSTDTYQLGVRTIFRLKK